MKKIAFAAVRPLIAFIAAAALAAGFFGDQPFAQQRGVRAGDANFDIRIDRDGAGAAYMARVAPPASFSAPLASAKAGVARLQDVYGALDLVDSPVLGTLEVVGAKAGSAFLSGPGNDRVAALRGFLATHADAYGLSLPQVQALELVADYVNPAGNMAWVEFQQRINGLPVFQGLVRGGFTARGELARVTGPLAGGLDAGALAMSPSIGAAQAVSLAASHVGWTVGANTLVEKSTGADGRVTFERGSMADDAKAWQVYFPLAAGVARLAWVTEIWGDPDVFLVVLDAQDGTVLFRKNLTSYQTQPATYVVYNDDSPAPMSPSTVLPGSGTQAPFIGRTSFTLIGNEGPNTFNNLGWMTDGTNVTDGNNVEAGVDLVGANEVDAPVTGVPNRTFNFAYNPETDDPATAAYRNGEVTDIFYWTNWYHDRVYLLGFTEAARNFQNDNFGRGGVQGDRISAEAQNQISVPACNPLPCSNNANFATSPDGTRGRMQMFIFPGPNPDRSSGIDHDVLLHELTHGTSNRLHSNALGLNTTMSAGMGEGWSDFYARALLSSAGENVNGIFSTGGWVTNQFVAGYVDNYYYGIRRFPYAVKTTVGANGKPHNPLTFADIDPTQVNLTDGAFPRGPLGSGAAFQVHNIGEVWASALLEVRARFITRLGFATGNQRILQFVTDAMKLDPVSPTLLQGRDSLIAAANASGTAADITDIWAGFATRGMGVIAAVNDASTGSVTENFNVPGDVIPTFSINDVSLTEGNAGTKTFTFNVTLATPSASESRVSFATANGTATSATTVTQAGAITIPSAGAAAPYPSALVVSGLPASILRVKARLNSMTHTFPRDLDIMLVGPGGQKVMLMSDVSANGVSGVTLNFDDGAPLMAFGSSLVNGATYGPTDATDAGGTDVFPGPAPAGPYGTALSVFNGTNPNGTWNLYVFDDEAGDSGSIAGGFSLLITTAADDYVPASGQLIFPAGGSTTQSVNVTVNGDVSSEVDETFFVNLSSPINGFIADSQGIGTILNDDGTLTPSVVTGAASSITQTGATLNGTANPNGFSTTASFEYGLTTSYGSTTPGQAMGAGVAALPIGGGAISGLSCSTLYHFRATATNVNGTANGVDATFTTAACPPPTVVTGAASSVGVVSATLNGTVNPNGFGAIGNFQWGLTTSYGNTTPSQVLGSGSSPVAIGGGTISPLTCNTLYHFRAVGSNPGGSVFGSDATFTTGACAIVGNPSSSPGFVYALDQVNGAANQIYGYRLSVSGAFTLLPGFPVASGGNGGGSSLSEHLAYKNGLLYVLNDGSASLSVFVVNASGALTPAPYSPIALSGSLACVAANPVNNTVIVGGSAGLTGLVITPATATVAAGSPVVTGGSAAPYSCAFSRDGNYAYTGGNVGTAIAGFSVAPSTGVLTPLAGSPFESGAGNPVGYATDNAGRLFSSNFGSGVRAFTTSSGIPAAVSGNPFPSGLSGGVHGLLNPLGFYMVADRVGNRVGVYQIAGSGAATTLTAVAGSPFASGGAFTDIVAQATDGRLLFAANATARSLSVFGVDASTGALTALMVQPVNTLGVSGALTGLVFAKAGSAFGDFDADAKGDLLLRNKFNGQNIGWLMNGLTVANSALMPTIADTNWEIRGRGDFDGDGKADVILRNKFNGQNIGWLMNGLTVSNSALMPTIADTNWEIRGIGDFDGDGKADVILRNKSSGQNIGWLMNGLTVANSALMPTIADTNWEIVGIGDFNGDGKADVLLRNKSNGQNIGWLMNGLTVSIAAFLPTIADTNWEIKGVGDLDGDGKADVVLRNKASGANIGWLMNGLTVSTSAFLPTIADTNWEIKGLGDFDGDGKSDVILRNKASGANIGWLMNGLTVSTSAFMPTIADTNWDFVGQGQ
jgi:hypothetical protein